MNSYRGTFVNKNRDAWVEINLGNLENNVLEIKKQVWINDTAPTPITCRVRYLIDEDKYYVFFYTSGNYANNCDTMNALPLSAI